AALGNLRDSIALELVTEIARPHHGLLASKIGKKASTNLGAIHFPLNPKCFSHASNSDCATRTSPQSTEISMARNSVILCSLRETNINFIQYYY
ncbi:hypothetical protein, partial [Brucella anthropi]|uniref:hypothetical protein n=1 Tax=Brucella anthropi TaxID=529 RepID=UPI003985A292